MACAVGLETLRIYKYAQIILHMASLIHSFSYTPFVPLYSTTNRLLVKVTVIAFLQGKEHTRSCQRSSTNFSDGNEEAGKQPHHWRGKSSA